MLIKTYFSLQSKINTIKYSIHDKHPGRLGVFKVLKLFLLEIILIFFRYLLILVKNPSQSFKILVNQPALAVCPYSYAEHKTLQKRLRVFSIAGFVTLISATIISSMILNLATGPILNTRAATFNWQQASWDASATGSSTTSHNPSSGPPSNWTQYSTKDSNLSVVNSGADLQVSSQNNTWTVTNDGTTDTGFNNTGTSKSSTVVSGSGDSAGVMLSTVAGDGSLVTAFDSDGIATSDPWTSTDNIQSVALDSTSIYSAGFSSTANSWRIEKRNKTTGALDTNFDTDGIIDLNLGGQNDQINSIAVDSTYLYLAGYQDYNGCCDMGDWRIEKRNKTTGALDTNFDTDGIITVNGGGQDFIHSIAIDANYIYAAGYDTPSAGNSEWRVEKRNITTGALVTAFDTDGIVISNPGSNHDRLHSIAIDASYMYLAGYDTTQGASDGQIRIEKRNITTGALETAFDTDGIVTYNPSSAGDVLNSIAVDSNFIYAAGYDSTPGNTQLYVEKRNITTGALVTAFDTDGIIQSNTSGATDLFNYIAIDSSYIYLAGYDNDDGCCSDPHQRWRMEKRDITTGALVTSFDTDGVVTVESGGYYHMANALALDVNYVYIGGYDDPSAYDGRWRLEKRLNAYYPTSGTFTSHIYNTTGDLTYGNLSWTNSGDQNITMKARTCDDSACSGETAIGSCTNIPNGTALSTGGCATSGHQYVQFQATLSSDDISQTPNLADASIAYTNYPTTNQTLTSSTYDTSSSGNILSKISWNNSSLPSGTQVRFQIRSSSNGTSWSDWCGYADTGSTCSGSNYFEASHNNVAIPTTNPLLSAGFGTPELNDQWVQYKVFLTATTTQTPTLSDLTLQYVVNAPPEFGTNISSTGVTAIQNSDGTVTVQYEIRDTDTTTGTTTPNYLTPTFAYTLNGTDYVAITSSYLASGDLDNKAVTEGAYSTYSATWSPKNQINGNYSTTAKIRVTINDNEAANYSANAASANFTLDTTNPALGSPSISVNPSSASAPATATVTLSATDNSSLQMKVGQASDLSDASWETYSSSKTVTLDSNPDTVYAQFKDAYNNTTTIGSSTTATTPESPSSIMLQDTSNLRITPNQLRIFVAWKVVTTPNPGFKQYNVWRSTDNFVTNQTQITTINNIDTNYYMDITPAASTDYYYRVSSQDSNDNISFFSGSVKAKANGVQDEGEGGGGQEATLPTISSVSTSNIQTTQATITWTTDELTNSTVGYSTDTSYSTETGVASYVTSHSVTLTGLTPATTYYFQVKSTDPSNNQTTDNNNSSGYTFTTLSGPTITNVDNEILSNTSAKIVWYTNLDSNSYVVYSSNSDLTNSTETGTTALAGGTGPSYYHAVTLSSLTQGTTYYYYVKSTDGDGNIAINDNGLNYYTFKTTQDSTSPSISDITVSTTTPDTVVITWTTNEPSTSQIAYGTTTTYASSTTADTDLVLTHIVSITNLIPNTTYNFQVRSQDSSGNESTSSNQTFTTGKESDIKQDQTAPTLTNVSVSLITSNSATVAFTSSENCSGYVGYGTTTEYGETKGGTSSTASHSVNIGGLLASTIYHFQAKCVDASSNVGSSQDQTFSTLAPTSTGEGGRSEVEKRVENLISENFSPEDIRNAVKRLQSPPSISGSGPEIKDIRSTSAKINWNTDKKSNGMIIYSTDQLAVADNSGETVGNMDEQSLAHEVSLKSLVPGTTYYFRVKSQDIYGNTTTSETKLFSTLIVPLISSVEVSDISLSSATISWKTSVITTGYVEYGKDTNYGEVKKHEDETSKGTTHSINIINLAPTTVYHFRIKGTSSSDSSLISSEDYTFQTQALPEIKDEEIKKISDNSAKITFNTNIETDTQILYKSLKSLGDYEQKGKKDLTKTHEIVIENLEFGADYSVMIKVKDAYENEAQKDLPTFTTGIDLSPPTISLLRTENALIPGKKDKVQTIISWKTDELSTTQIMYQEGIDVQRKELKEKNQEDKSLTKDHVVVLTTLKPGAVYQLRAISADNQGNIATSKDQTMLTPKQQESVFQVIMKNLEDVFGWVKQVGK